MGYNKETLAWEGEPEVKETERVWNEALGVWEEVPKKAEAPIEAPKKVAKKSAKKKAR